MKDHLGLLDGTFTQRFGSNHWRRDPASLDEFYSFILTGGGTVVALVKMLQRKRPWVMRAIKEAEAHRPRLAERVQANVESMTLEDLIALARLGGPRMTGWGLTATYELRKRGQRLAAIAALLGTTLRRVADWSKGETRGGTVLGPNRPEFQNNLHSRRPLRSSPRARAMGLKGNQAACRDVLKRRPKVTPDASAF